MQPRQNRRLQPAHHTRKSAYRAIPVLPNVNPVAGMPAGALSAYAKLAAPVLATAALWLHVWLGLAVAVAVAFLVAAATLVLQRLPVFAREADSWARAVSFGERVWLNRQQIPVPARTSSRITALYLVFWFGTIVALIGGGTASHLLTVSGLLVAYCAQVVCFQNLIQLYERMKGVTPLYRFWSSLPGNDNLKL